MIVKQYLIYYVNTLIQIFDCTYSMHVRICIYMIQIDTNIHFVLKITAKIER